MVVRSSKRVQQKLTSDTAQIAPARKLVEQFAVDAALSDTAAGELGLAVNEALANVIRHAYAGAPGRPIELTVERNEDEVVVSIRDWGDGKEPTSPSEPARDPTTPGGLGMICMKSLTDRLSYTPLADGMLLVMAKRIKGKT
jgi:anti-sigma regulatory factor (Ser/Thr protein kinase)